MQKAMKNTNFISSSFNHLIFNLYPAHFGTGSTFLSKNIDLNTRYNSFFLIQNYLICWVLIMKILH